MESASGFIAALDQSGGSTPKALGMYGVTEDAWSSDEEMFSVVHEMRTRIITSPAFTSVPVTLNTARLEVRCTETRVA